MSSFDGEDVHHWQGVVVDGYEGAPSELNRRDEGFFGGLAMGLSVGIVGFFLAGQFTIAAVGFAAVATGCVFGWVARGGTP